MANVSLTCSLSRCLLLAVAGLFACDCTAQFTEVSSSLGISNVANGTYDGSGLSWYDFNNDGYDDLTLGAGHGDVRFFLNDGAGDLFEVFLGIDNIDDAQVKMVLWGDYDRDGDADLLITHDMAPVRLWNQQEDNSFTEVAVASGIPEGIFHYFGAAWCDVDHDGYLDLYIAKFYNPIQFPLIQYRSDFFHNNGDGTFTETTEEIGLDLPPRPCFQPVFMDFNHDGWEDLYLIVDREWWSNELFQNNGDGTFTDVTPGSGAGVMIGAMSGTVDDFDNDADLDIYVSNGPEGNVLLRNDNSVFTEIGVSAGVTVNAICWGSLWLDYDNNSWQDLFVGTTIGNWGPYENKWYINNEDQTFSPGNEATNTVDDMSPTIVTGMGDLNNDGYYDYANNNNDPFPTDIWLNQGGTNNYLSVSVQGVESNYDGIGTWIDCYAGGFHYVRFRLSGENCIAQNSEKEIFGLGSIAQVDSLVINWPLGLVETYYDVQVNQHLHLIEGASFLQPFNIAYNADLPLCAGDSLLLSAPVGVSYLWSTGETTPSIYVAEPGVYSAAVVTEEGYTINSNPLEVTYLSEVSVVTNAEMVSCYGAADGSIQLTVSPGVTAFIDWNTSNTGTILSNLAPGIYTCTGLTTLGCDFQDTIVITQPDALLAQAIITSVSCYGLDDGAVIFDITGGTPEYQITADSGEINALDAGLHSITITDSNNCVLELEIEIPEPEPFVMSYAVDSISCFGFSDGAITINEINGGTPPYSFSGDIENSGSLAEGPHSFVVTDSMGCDSLVNFEIGEPALLELNVITTSQYENGPEGTAESTIAGGTPPYSILWSNDEADVLTIDELNSAWYSVEVTDANGCVASADFFIPFVIGIYELIPENCHIYPNPASHQISVDTCKEIEILSVGIMSVDGRLIFERSAVDGKITSLDISTLPAGSYFVALRTSQGNMFSEHLIVLPH